MSALPIMRLADEAKERRSWADLPPRDYRQNIIWRRRILQMAEDDKTGETKRMLWMACAREPLFWINGFSFIYEPRGGTPRSYAWVTWPYQDDVFRKLFAALGRHDIVLAKAREMGATWMVLATFAHSFMFKRLSSFLVISRKEDLVDKLGDPDCLFWKLDFLLQRQPDWLRPRMDRSLLKIRNLENGSTINGDSTNADVGRGGRRTAIMLDEAATFERGGYSIDAATFAATECRFWVSTPKGVGNAFADKWHDDVTAKIALPWTLHPLKTKDLTIDVAGEPTSSWFVRECKKLSHPRLIAQELKIDFVGSDYEYYDADSVMRAKERDGRKPFQTGELEIDLQAGEPIGFVEAEKGRLNLWCVLDERDRPNQTHRYVMGIDVAQGTGASNSVIAVIDRTTMEKVAEFASANTRPEDLAKIAAGMGRWFSGLDGRRGAYAIWESQGPGRNFGDKLLELGYGHVYYRRAETTTGKRAVDIPGFHKNRETATILLGQHRAAIAGGEYIERSLETLNECRQYVFTKSGDIEHSRSANTIDPSGAKSNHADRVIATALALLACRETAATESKEPEIPPNCMAFWLRERRREEREKRYIWNPRVVA